MSAIDSTQIETTQPRPKRADARRNYDKIVVAARDAFAELGAKASLEEIARRAGVGIGTLYRNFPNRQALLEAVYVGELEALCRSAGDLGELAPGDALVGWLHRFVGYVATKQALSAELLEYLDRDAPLFASCRTAMYASGEPLLARAQDAGEVRADVNLEDVLHMVMGIAKAPMPDPDRQARIVDIALDGLRVGDRR